jgi:hypothetical protein
VHAVLDGRHARRSKKRTHNFAFSGLISCGHCGCALVGEIKRTLCPLPLHRVQGEVPVPYTREEVLEEKFAEILKRISFSSEVLEWVKTALRDSHKDEKQFHEEAIAKLQRERQRIQDRTDAMYMDKLDGRIDNEFFDRKAGEFRSEQCRIMRDIEAHEAVNRSYIEDCIKRWPARSGIPATL